LFSAPSGVPNSSEANGHIKLLDIIQLEPLVHMAAITLVFTAGSMPDGQIVAFNVAGSTATTTVVPSSHPTGTGTVTITLAMVDVTRLEISAVGSGSTKDELELISACPS
jgi:hypothetical protein